jgi:hypothetical protein
VPFGRSVKIRGKDLFALPSFLCLSSVIRLADRDRGFPCYAGAFLYSTVPTSSFFIRKTFRLRNNPVQAESCHTFIALDLMDHPHHALRVRGSFATVAPRDCGQDKEGLGESVFKCLRRFRTQYCTVLLHTSDTRNFGQ